MAVVEQTKEFAVLVSRGTRQFVSVIQDEGNASIRFAETLIDVAQFDDLHDSISWAVEYGYSINRHEAFALLFSLGMDESDKTSLIEAARDAGILTE